MIAWFAKNAVAANLLMITILMGGLLSLNNKIPLEVFPSIDLDKIQVDVNIRGATPEEVEKGIAIKIEEAVQDLEGIKQIRSTSKEGAANVLIDVETGYDARNLLADIKSRVDAINTFPVEAEKPIISLMKKQKDVITVSVTSEYGEQELRTFAAKVRDDLLRLNDVTQVELGAVRHYQINIHVSKAALQKYQLTFKDISDAINRSSVDISAGNIKTEGGDVLVRSRAQAYTKEDYESIVIRTQPDGSFLHIKDVASVDDGFEQNPVRARFNGHPAAFIDVYRVGNQSAIKVADAVKDYVEKTQTHTPQGFTINYWDDDSEVVKSRLSTLINNAIQGSLLVLLLLALFLRPYIAFWVFIGIPVSFIGALFFMPILGISINILSLFGFILVLGIVVDDAIVTGENIYRHSKDSSSSLDAAIKGAEEVALPVTFGVLTTVVAFLPLAFIEGSRGALFAQIPAIVIPVLLISLVESKFVLPAHLSRMKLRQSDQPSAFAVWQERFADHFERAIIRYYQPLLKMAIHNKRLTIVCFVGVLIIIIALLKSGHARFQFMPKISSETAKATLYMPEGTPFDVVDQQVMIMEQAAILLKERYTDQTGQSLIKHILSTAKGDEGKVRFEILSADKNNTGVTIQQLVNEWRELIGDIPGADSLYFRAEIGRSSDPIDIQLSGNNTLQMQALTEKVKAKLNTYPAVFDVWDSLSEGKQELQIELKPQGQALGLSTKHIADQVRHAVFGLEVQRIQRGRDDVRVMLSLPETERQSISQMDALTIETPLGKTVPLSHVAWLHPSKSPTEIDRVDRFRTVNIVADVDKGTANMTLINKDILAFLAEQKRQFPDVQYSLEGEAKEQRESFGSLATGLVFIFFIIYCLLAIPFRSYVQPLIVMSVIPFGLIGAVVGHWILRMDFTIMSILGLMALVGVVVNDSLVLVDYINQQKRLGKKVIDAVLTAGTVRFRPVLLTSLTTFIGLVPLLFERSTQAKFLFPMAISLGFGIVFATFITLILVPVNYLMVEKIKAALRRF
ncbi:MAG: efflux RND transporter permease subunit [Cellvibrionales bacterium]|nr:efflux RND transporter permease subunit [Cellvibrionales bacterium]